jgi:hypothetical protein
MTQQTENPFNLQFVFYKSKYSRETKYNWFTIEFDEITPNGNIYAIENEKYDPVEECVMVESINKKSQHLGNLHKSNRYNRSGSKHYNPFLESLAMFLKNNHIKVGVFNNTKNYSSYALRIDKKYLSEAKILTMRFYNFNFGKY